MKIKYPKDKLSETRAPDRKKMAKLVAELCEEFGIPHRIEEEFLGQPRCIAVHIRSHLGLCLTVDFDGSSCQPNTFVLSWHTDRSTPDNLVINPEFCYDLNPYHKRKATDVAFGWDNLMIVLRRRLSMMRNEKEMIEN